MSQSQVISFRASGHFLNWVEVQKLEGESVSQAAQRILKEISGVYDNHRLPTVSSDYVSTSSTEVSTNSSDYVPTPSTEVSTLSSELSTSNIQSVVSTNIVDNVDKLVSDRLDPVIKQIATIEERLGKLRA